MIPANGASFACLLLSHSLQMGQALDDHQGRPTVPEHRPSCPRSVLFGTDARAGAVVWYLWKDSARVPRQCMWTPFTPKTKANPQPVGREESALGATGNWPVLPGDRALPCACGAADGPVHLPELPTRLTFLPVWHFGIARGARLMSEYTAPQELARHLARHEVLS